MHTARSIRPAAALVLALTMAAIAGVAAGFARAPRFYRDDPIARDPETQNAAAVREAEVSELYDFTENSFFGAGDKTSKPAVNVNTAGEVPDSSWFTNRLGRVPMTIEQLVKGPDTGSGPVGAWTIVSGKMEGRAPGFTIRDEAGQIYFIKFDPPANPEMATAAEVIATKFFHAFGYHVPENYLATMRREALTIGDGAEVNDRRGRRPMRPRDIDDLLERAAKNADGTYRAVASKALEGKPVGPFRYYGTRPDDPNDIFPHEHRRELRGLLAFCAWLNHDDSRSINSLDTLVTAGGRTIVRHHLLDFGSTLGSGTLQAQSTRAGNEFLWESRPTFITMLTLGFYVRPWIKVPYPEIPSLGRIEAAHFDPQDWKPEYPNAAFSNARPEDLFWAARILAALSDDAIRAVVETGRYSDARAAAYLTETLVERRRKILAAWLNGVNPVVEPVLSASGALTFANAAQKAGVGDAADEYIVQWSQFDNASGEHKNIGAEQTARETRAQAPAELLAGGSGFVAARIRARHRERAAWSQPVTVYFRRAAEGWSLVGLDR